MMHTAARFDDSLIVPRTLNCRRIEDWKTRWRRISSSGMNINRDHFVIGREIGDRWIGIVR